MNSATTESRNLVLIKGAQRFEIRYEVGDEQRVTDAIVNMANSGQIDWFEAALMSIQLTQQMKRDR